MKDQGLIVNSIKAMLNTKIQMLESAQMLVREHDRGILTPGLTAVLKELHTFERYIDDLDREP